MILFFSPDLFFVKNLKFLLENFWTVEFMQLEEFYRTGILFITCSSSLKLLHITFNRKINY